MCVSLCVSLTRCEMGDKVVPMEEGNTILCSFQTFGSKPKKKATSPSSDGEKHHDKPISFCWLLCSSHLVYSVHCSVCVSVVLRLKHKRC